MSISAYQLHSISLKLLNNEIFFAFPPFSPLNQGVRKVFFFLFFPTDLSPLLSLSLSLSLLFYLSSPTFSPFSMESCLHSLLSLLPIRV